MKLRPVKPLVSAHRGGHVVDGRGAAQRYRDAIALGVDFVEFDVRKTRDGVTIVCHDDCTVSGRLIRNFAYHELIDELGSEALTFDELLDVAAGKVGLHLDLKETGYEDEIVTAVLAKGPLDKLAITGGDDAITALKERFPHVHAGLSIGDELDGASPWRTLTLRFSEMFPRRRFERCHADFVAVHWQLGTLNVLRYCAANSIPAWVWTVDDERSIKRLLADHRVTTLVTNRPDIALRIRDSA